MAHARADCGSGSPTVSGRTEIDGLVVNGLSTIVTGAPNQTISLLGGAMMILNEQTTSLQNGSITVNAIHVTVPGVTDVIINSAFAAISGQLQGSTGGPHRIVALLLRRGNTSSPCGFATGGGWIKVTEPENTTAKGTLGASRGNQQYGTPFGPVETIVQGTG